MANVLSMHIAFQDSTNKVSNFHLFLSNDVPFYFMNCVDCACCRWSLSEETFAGWQEIPKNASRSTAVASGMSFLSSFWEIYWEPGMFYNLHCFSQNRKHA